MQTNRKSLGVFIIILGLILLGLVIYFSFFYGADEPTVTPINNETPAVINNLPDGEVTPTTTPGDKPRNYQQYDLSQAGSYKSGEADLVKIAEAFAERFGSYSNYSNFSNFSDLQIFMTSSMKTWADEYVAGLRAAAKDGDAYYGITTTAITGKASAYDEKAGTAQITISTARRESIGEGSESSAFNQDIAISLKKVNGEWLVDKAVWQSKK
ncbi:MAG: hypothetical protein HY931_02575 [Candidatus Falkowbacteria bacterium]|nr:MAG: hypothetical protein HY931_02575 [Candidatus Falkowbacteria bacterium]